MKKFYRSNGAIIGIASALFFSFAPLLLAQSADAAIAINELGIKETSDYEWVELYNSGAAPVDLAGWKFFEDKSNHGLSVFRGTSTVAAGEYAIIANKADLLAQKYPDYAGTILDSSWGSLKEDGEEIGLKDAAGNFIELFTYPAMNGTSSSVSLERIDVNVPAAELTNWAPHPTSQSLGKPNQNSSVPQSEVPPATESGSTTAVIEAPTQDQSGTSSLISDAPSETAATSGSSTSSEAPPPAEESPPPAPEPPPAPTPPASPPGPMVSLPPIVSPKAIIKVQKNSIKITNKKSSTGKKTPPRNSPLPEAAIVQEKNLGFQISGYIILQPTGDPDHPFTIQFTQAPNKKIKQKVSSKQTASTKTSSAHKRAFTNGNLSEDIAISEIMPGKKGVTPWIEIFNGGSSAVNLGNWMIANNAKKSSPFFIPDTVKIAPGGYVVLKKSQTHLALKAASDSVFLADYEGNIIDSVSYDHAPKDRSYALVSALSIPSSTATGQSLQDRPADQTWEWVDAPTPGKPNPIFEPVLAADAQSVFAAAAANELQKKNNFTESVTDLPAADAMANGANAQEKSSAPWGALGILVIGIALNAPPLFVLAKNYLRARKKAAS